MNKEFQKLEAKFNRVKNSFISHTITVVNAHNDSCHESVWGLMGDNCMVILFYWMTDCGDTDRIVFLVLYYAVAELFYFMWVCLWIFLALLYFMYVLCFVFYLLQNKFPLRDN